MSSENISVDVVVIGDGAQALATLGRLRGYTPSGSSSGTLTCVLLSEQDIGAVDTQHLGWLHSGAVIPLDHKLKATLDTNWKPLVEGSGSGSGSSSVAHESPAFLSCPRPIYNGGFKPLWAKDGIGAEDVESADLPIPLQGGLFGRESDAQATIPDTILDKKALLSTLLEPVKDAVLRGKIVRINTGPANRHVKSITFAPDALGGETEITVTGKYVICCNGISSPDLARKVKFTGGFQDDFLAEIDAAFPLRAQTVLCVKGPSQYLCNTSLYHWQSQSEKGFFCNTSRTREEDQQMTYWTCSMMSPTSRNYLSDVRSPPSGGEAPLDEGLVREALDSVYARVPSLAQHIHQIHFGAYAVFRTDVAGPKPQSMLQFSVTTSEVLSNICFVNTGIETNIFDAALQAVKVAAKTIGATPAALNSVPNGGEGVVVADIPEDRAGFEWSTFDVFSGKYQAKLDLAAKTNDFGYASSVSNSETFNRPREFHGEIVY